MNSKDLYRPCVGIVLFNKNGEIFAGQRVDDKIGYWQMPQGGIDFGETEIDAAFREIYEETGILKIYLQVIATKKEWLYYDIPSHILSKWSNVYIGQKQKWFLMRFLGDDQLINLNINTPEFISWKWLEINQLLEKVISFKRSVYEKVFDDFYQIIESMR